MKYRMMATIIGLTLTCNTLSAHAVTAWWAEPRMLVEADEAIIPVSLINETPPNPKRWDNTMDTADTLRIGDKPFDRVISIGDQNWFLLEANDGPGYIRIGATGPINFTTASLGPNKGLQGGMSGSFDGPSEGAALLETSITSITELAAIRRHKQAYMKISTSSPTPVSYRISFVSELPENRVGCAYGPGVAANQYIMALARESSLSNLYRTTRIRYTKEQAMALREKLFGTKRHLGLSLQMHSKDPSADINAIGKLPIQHIILTDDESMKEGKAWAFVVTCEQRDGLWLVTDASRDPEITEEELTGIIRRDLERMSIPLGEARKLKSRPIDEPPVHRSE
jgi:hypothetical protein